MSDIGLAMDMAPDNGGVFSEPTVEHSVGEDKIAPFEQDADGS